MRALTLGLIAALLACQGRSAEPVAAPSRAPVAPSVATWSGSPITLAVGRSTFASGREVQLSGSVAAPSPPVVVERSVFRITSGAGKVVFEDRGAFLLESGEPLRSMTSSGGPTLPADLADGDYRALWRVNDLVSNALSIRIDHAFDVRKAAPLVIALLEDEVGRKDPARILVQFTNVGDAPVNLPNALGESVLVAGGVVHRRQAPLLWGGSSLLAPGSSWGTVERLADYGVSANATRIGLRLAGTTSADLALESP